MFNDLSAHSNNTITRSGRVSKMCARFNEKDVIVPEKDISIPNTIKHRSLQFEPDSDMESYCSQSEFDDDFIDDIPRPPYSVSRKTELYCDDDLLLDHTDDRLKAGREALTEYIKRTDIKKHVTVKLDEELLQRLLDVGVPPSNIQVFQSVSMDRDDDTDDEATFRGGFTPSERKRVNKIPLNSRSFKRIPGGKEARAHAQRRFISRLSLPEGQKGATICLDADGYVVAIALQDALNEESVKARKLLIEFCELWDLLGWAKACGLSGLARVVVLFRFFSACALGVKDKTRRDYLGTRRSYFGNKYKEYQAKRLLPSTKSGRPSDSTKLEYVNRDGELKTFQAGNFIHRTILGYHKKNKNPVYRPEVRPYLKTVLELLEKFNDKILFTGSVHRLAEDPPVDLNECDESSFRHAVNRFDSRYHFQPAMHQDSIVNSACVASCFVKGGEIHTKDIGASGGQLFIEYGMILPYASTDVIIFCGNCFHCPLPVHPYNGKNATDLCRYSIVTFLGKHF